MTKAARTCCPTHTDNCRRNFGEHLWAGPYRVAPGSPEDYGDGMSHPDDLKCGYCEGTCTADRGGSGLGSTGR